MEEYRAYLITRLDSGSEAGAKNAKSIVDKLTDAEIATLYLAFARPPERL